MITDPIFSDRIGVSPIPGWTIGPKRHTGPAADVPDVLHPDLILLSHAHMDHFDFPSLRKLAHWETSVVTARGTGHLLRRMKFESVRELAPGDTCVAEGVKVTAVGVRHWGNRFPWNHDYGFNGYVMEYGGSRIFYAGDTANTESFRALQDMWPIDIAIMPIGAYAPDSFQGSHCTPEQAWEMFLDTGAKYLVPVHWDTFVLSQEPVDEPMKRLLEAAGDDRDRIVIREHGQMFELPPDV